MKFNQLIKKDIIFLDGGFGTELIKKGLKPGEDSASAVFEHPQWVEEIHRSYVEAGSNVILANTFGANAFKLKNSPYTVEESINKAVNIVKKGENLSNRDKKWYELFKNSVKFYIIM